MGKLIDVLKSYKGGLVMNSKQKDDIKSVLKYTITVICIIFVVFAIKEIIIKEQHNCMSTKYWKNRNNNFLLIAHEYIFVFQK